MQTRRSLLASAAALSLASRAGAWARSPTGPAQGAGLDDLLDRFFQENLRLRPESATQLGLDKGADADLKSKLSDASPAGFAAAKMQTQSQIARLRAVDRTGLGQAAQLDYDTVLYTLQSAQAVQRFEFGGSSFGPSPYVVSQLTGAYQSVPDFLDTKHRIETAADADAYLARLNAFAGQVEANTQRMRHDLALGVSPPDFLLDTTLVQLEKARVPAEQALVVTSITRRAAAKGLPASYGQDAARLYTARVLPALERQIAQVRAQRVSAGPDAGLWRLRDGAAFYATALQATTTTRLGPDEVHRIGLDQAKEISARLDTLLRDQGLTRGTVGERMAHLYADPTQLYPDTDAGKAQAIAYCNARLAAVRR